MQPMDGFLVLLVVTCAVTDVLRDRIYNVVTYPAIVVALAAAFAGRGAMTLAQARITGMESVTGFLLGFVPFVFLFVIRGVGGGDVKLFGAIGAVKGVSFVAFTMLYALFFGAVIGLITAAARGQLVPIVKRVGLTIWYSLNPATGPTSFIDVRGPKVNFGPAICMGTLLCLMGQIVGRQVLNF